MEIEKEELEKDIKGLFSEILKGAVEYENLKRNLSSFLSDNYLFSDFDQEFTALTLTKSQFDNLIKVLSDYFNDFGFTDLAGKIFIIMVRSNPENKKRIIIEYTVNEKNIYTIESVSGKTFTNV